MTSNEITIENNTGRSLQTETMQDSHDVMALIARAASDPSISETKLEALFNLKERVDASHARAEYNQAFMAMQKELPRIKKDGSVSYDKKKESFKFASFERIMEMITPILQRYGFALSYTTTPRQGDGGGCIVTGNLRHVGGHVESASIQLALDLSGGKNNIQGMGSTFSYGKRYTTTMLLNLITEGEDDDGVRGGFEAITPEQVENIKSLIKETGTDLDRFLMTIEHTEIESITKAELTIVTNMLLAKRKKQGV